MRINKPATAEDVQDFINWLKTQTGTYDAQDPDHCPIAQYLRSRGHTNVTFFGTYELYADGNKIDLPKIIGEIVYTEEGIGFAYGGALQRAQAALTAMIYGIKPSEDPGAALSWGYDPAPDLPTDDTN